jgi:uncharacterized membrane protein YjjB (DUF3815 family)
MAATVSGAAGNEWSRIWLVVAIVLTLALVVAGVILAMRR